MELDPQDVVVLLRNYPNQHEHHVMQELLRELNVQSKLMNLRQINQINGGLNEIHYF